MRKLATHEGIIEDGHVTLPPNTWILEEAGVYLLARDEMDQVPYVASPHLADPQQAEDFQMQIIEDAVNAGV